MINIAVLKSVESFNIRQVNKLAQGRQVTLTVLAFILLNSSEDDDCFLSLAVVTFELRDCKAQITTESPHTEQCDAVFLPNGKKFCLYALFSCDWSTFLKISFVSSSKIKTNLALFLLCLKNWRSMSTSSSVKKSYLILKNYIFFHNSNTQSSSLEMHLFCLCGAFI